MLDRFGRNDGVGNLRFERENPFLATVYSNAEKEWEI
jgi:hypothetical protein